VPNNITAEAGETVNFHFFPGNHSFAQSSFYALCVPIITNQTPVFIGFINPSGTGIAIRGATQMYTIIRKLST